MLAAHALGTPTASAIRTEPLYYFLLLPAAAAFRCARAARVFEAALERAGARRNCPPIKAKLSLALTSEENMENVPSVPVFSPSP